MVCGALVCCIVACGAMMYGTVACGVFICCAAICGAACLAVL